MHSYQSVVGMASLLLFVFFLINQSLVLIRSQPDLPPASASSDVIR